MRQFLVYDLPTRIFHWLFSGLFIGAFFIAKTIDDESNLYPIHMLIGLTLGFIALLRLIWGIIGSKHARFADFALNPLTLIDYMKNVFTSEKRKWAGHNPASSWATLIMIFQALGLAFTGYLMTATNNKETFEDLHEILANSFAVVAIFHVVGVIIHSAKHRDMIAFSMIDGKKSEIPPSEAIPSSKPAAGIIFLILTMLFASMLASKYDSTTQSLNLFGTTLQLGENEKESNEELNSNDKTEGENEESDED